MPLTRRRLAGTPVEAPSGAGHRRRVTAVVIGQNIATISDSMLLIFIPLMVLGVTRSPVQVAVAYIATQAPALAGGYATVPRRWLSTPPLLIAYDAGRCALMLAVAAVVAVPPPRHVLPLVYLLLAAGALLTAWFRPTRI